MPPRFERCVSIGGRVRTIKPTKGTHKKICFKGGRSYAGYTKKTKSSKKKRA